jgi:kinetochore protein Mis12/MTW1
VITAVTICESIADKSKQALLDDVVNSINELSDRAINAIEKGLLAADPTSIGFKIPPNSTPENTAAIISECHLEIEKGVCQFESFIQAKIDKNFDKFEIFTLRNILSIPPELVDWIRLSHYEGLNLTEYKDAPSLEEVILLRRKYRETQKLHALLESERARNEATLASLKKLILNEGPKGEPDGDTVMHDQNPSTYPAFAFLQNKGELTGEDQPITTTTSFALSQVPALRSLLENVEPRLRELADASAGSASVGEDQTSWRRGRLEFIEKETKRHLENSRGLELGEQSSVRDGEWQGEGRTLAKGEVESLEKVVGLIGGPTEGDPMMSEDA